MNRFGIVFLGILLVSSMGYGQSSSAPAQGAPAAVGHGVFPVRVVKTLDSSKLKEGDSIEVETDGSFKLANGTLIQKGSKLVGHVVAAKARSRGDADSQLTLSFEKLNIAKGEQLSIKGTIQAVYPPAPEPMAPSMATAGTSAGGSGGGGGSAGVGVINNKSGSDMHSSSTPTAVMDMKAVGVEGVHDLELDNGVLTSKGKSVKLGSDMRMIIRAEVFGS